MRSLFRGSLFAVACLGPLAPLAATRPDEKPKVTVEFRRAETKPTEGYSEAKIEGTTEKVYLPKKADATNVDIAEAKVGVDGDSNPAIDIAFTKEGAKKMEALSEKHKDKPLAIMIDGKVVSAPVVRAKFSSRAQITGKFTKEEVEKLVKAINEK
jgi:preprotein translocase subunit SecD